MHQRDVTFAASDGTRLAGTLTVPDSDSAEAASWPAALILNGSGPLDRDSAIPGQELHFAGPLAEQLAGAGVASFRFDKRGVGRSTGDFISTGLHAETDDAAAALAALAAESDVDAERLAAIGHSVGALIAVRLAASSSADPAVVAIVLLAGPAQDGRTVLAWQSARIAATLPGPSWVLPKLTLAAQGYSMSQIEQSSGDTARLIFKRRPARWMREFMAYEPDADLRRVHCPVLAITGRKDLQVDPDDVERIGALVSGKFQGETPDDVTHLLRSEPGPAGILSYRAQLKRPVDVALLERVSKWVAEEFVVP